ncbi:cytochrome b [Psychromonas hadalis]|uniref:cytochrome b n=1 Tax=Psychromonas hadalis TaxID=211669 RepID=UPI0003B436CD|nr:cytochrome b [Psychromonas hadalis]
MKIFVPTEHFSLLSKLIHIVSAVAFIAVLILMFNNPNADSLFFSLHQSLGLLVLVLYFTRIVWMNWAGKPKALGNKVEKFAAHMAHMALYGILILMPLSGLLIALAKAKETVVFGLFSIPGFSDRNSGLIDVAYSLHSFLEIVCYLLIAAHIGASLYHHLILKDGTLDRMMGKNK